MAASEEAGGPGSRSASPHHGPPRAPSREGRRHGPPWRHRRPPVGWMLARGIHRTLVGFLLVALLLGGLGGAVLHAALAHGFVGKTVCVGTGILCLVWPLAWMATARIAWPLKALAKVAGELHGGRLQSREDLPGGPGEVGEVGEALRGMAERVAKQLRDQRSLMAAVSHELRSPLGRARVMVEMAREGSAPATVYDDLQAEIDAMDNLVGDLLAAARIDFEAVSPRELDPEAVARRAAEQAPGGRWGQPEVAVEGVRGVILADPTLLGRALGVLLDNARRYGGERARLLVRGRLGRVRFLVEDDGPGFPEGDPERAFQPFWRGPGQAGPGEGLGLALVRQIAEAHQGEAGAENRPEGGARVWIELPWKSEANQP